MDRKYQQLINLLRSEKKLSDVKTIDKSYQYATQAIENKERAQEKTEFLINVGLIAVKEIGLGVTSVNAIFLSAAVINRTADIKKLTQEYKDKQLLVILEGLVKINEIDTSATDKTQAENLRKLLLNMASDMRVVLIKVAEHVQTMRILSHLNKDEQIRVASEASFLYAPLAHRLGLYIIKSELEDLSLKFTQRDTYNTIARKLNEKMKARKEFISSFIRPIEHALNKQGFDFEIKGRPKSIYSIWNKMNKKNTPFEDIYDLFAIRIILNSPPEKEKADCWQVYSIVTDLYQPNPKRLRDWISVPKTNGYESLHITVVGPDGKWVEVQIRTQRMNEIAEKGLAAHWKYKGIEEEQGLDEWLVKIREILETPEPDAVEFIDDFKLSLYQKEIFVFTPNGDLRKFPSGATVLDFAFDIHSDLGASCIGAKVNDKNVPIKYVMQNGDRVEIIKSKNQSPKLDWLNVVVTSKAKSKIRQKLNEDKFKEAETGKEMLKRRFKNWKLDFNDEAIRKLLDHYNYKIAQDLYFDIAREKIDLGNVKDLLIENAHENNSDEGRKINVDTIVGEDFKQEFRKTNDFLVIDEKIGNVDYRLSKCCNPVFGDKVFGFVTINEGIKIHRLSCPNAAQLLTKYGYRVVQAKWTRTDKDTLFPVELRITGVDDFNILTKINDTISKDTRVKLRSISMESDDGIFDGKLKLMIKDLQHLDFITSKLKQINGVINVGRAEKN